MIKISEQKTVKIFNFAFNRKHRMPNGIAQINLTLRSGFAIFAK